MAIDEAEAAKDGKRRGVMTGIPTLDKMTGGFRPTRTWVLGAQTSMGKSTLAGQFALRAAEHDHGVLYLSLEMPADQIWQRMASSATGINGELIRDGKLSNADIARLTTECSAMSVRLKGRLLINSRCSREINDLLATIRAQHRRCPVKLVIVDYIQNSRVGRKISRDTNRNNDIETSAIALADLARELEICMLIVSQFNRGANDGRPSLVNLRDSGAIEQCADVVVLMWNDEPGNEYRRVLAVEKNKDGRKGEIITVMNPNRMTFGERTDL
jgi:replicative DNA helicase